MDNGDSASVSNEVRITRLETNLKNLIHTVGSLAESVQADSQSMKSAVDGLAKVVNESRKLSWPMVFTVIGTGLTAIALVTGAMLFWVNLSLLPLESNIEQVRVEANLYNKILKLELEKDILKAHNSNKP